MPISPEVDDFIRSFGLVPHHRTDDGWYKPGPRMELKIPDISFDFRLCKNRYHVINVIFATAHKEGKDDFKRELRQMILS